jgi:maleylacetoacetate isomerase
MSVDLHPLLVGARLHMDPRSSATLRVLCALRHKDLPIPSQVVRLREGAHQSAEFTALNPSRAVPVLELANGQVFPQSMAILEFIEALHPAPPLMPTNPCLAAQVRALCNLAATDLHPLVNFSVRGQLTQQQGADAAQAWYAHWSAVGLDALDGWLARWSGSHCVGDSISLADFFVAPAFMHCLRLDCAPARAHRMWPIYERLTMLPAFAPLREAWPG